MSQLSELSGGSGKLAAAGTARANLIELRGLTEQKLPTARKQEAERELTRAIGGIDKHLNREQSDAHGG